MKASLFLIISDFVKYDALQHVQLKSYLLHFFAYYYLNVDMTFFLKSGSVSLQGV